MDKNIEKIFTLNLRSKGNNKGFIIDFMTININDNTYPFINIYYFKDTSSLHKHYIINIEGNLEIAHDHYKDRWIDNSIDLPFEESGIIPPVMRPLIIDYKNHAYKNKMALTKYYRTYSGIETYLYLIRHALLPYVSNNYIEEPIGTLINVLKSVSDYDIPLSKPDKEKKSLIKH